MSFQIKDFASITAAQINHARSVTDRVTDFQPGSVVRTIMESASVEIEELYLQMFLGLRDAIPVATFQSFNFAKLPAKVAHGRVSVTTAAPLATSITIPAGTEFRTSEGLVFVASQTVTFLSGTSSVYVPVSHSVAGYIGNVAAGAINSSPLFNASFEVGNAAITSGADAESDEDREARFAMFVRSLSRGTLAACEYAVRETTLPDVEGNIYEYVTRLGAYEEAGRVAFYIRSSLGDPSADLLAAAQASLDGSRDDATGVIRPGYRPAGVRVDVLPMAVRSVPFSIQVEMLPSYTLSVDVAKTLTDLYFGAVAAVLPSRTLTVHALMEILLNTPGVSAITPITTANITCSFDEALVAGNLTITTP